MKKFSILVLLLFLIFTGCQDPIPGTSPEQLTDEVLVSSKSRSNVPTCGFNILIQSYARNNKIYSRTVSVQNDKILWETATRFKESEYWKPLPPGLTPFPPYYIPDICFMNEIKVNSTIVQHIGIASRTDLTNLNWIYIYERKIPVINYEIRLDIASSWTGRRATEFNFPGTGKLQNLDFFTAGNKLYQGFWRGNTGYSREVLLTDGDFDDWRNTSSWAVVDVLSILPGWGEMRSQNTFVICNIAHQGYWRSYESGGFPDNGWYRSNIQYDGMKIIWPPVPPAPPIPFSGPLWLDPAVFPGSGHIQGQSGYPAYLDQGKLP